MSDEELRSVRIWANLATMILDGSIVTENATLAARRLEDEIERRGLQAKYITALAEIVPGADWMPFENWGASQVWAFLRATPEQRAGAFFKAIDYQR